MASARLGPLVSAPKEGSWGKLVRNLDDAEVIADDADFKLSVISGDSFPVTLPNASLANPNPAGGLGKLDKSIKGIIYAPSLKTSGLPVIEVYVSPAPPSPTSAILCTARFSTNTVDDPVIAVLV
jgi:hypothetical protein